MSWCLVGSEMCIRDSEYLEHLDLYFPHPIFNIS
jgi:hypothetical protein